MKLIFAIVNKHDSHDVQTALTGAGFLATKLATTGTFLMAGNITFIIGTEDENVETALSIIKENSEKRVEQLPANVAFGIGMTATQTIDVTVGGATVFVVDVDQFQKF